MEGCLTPDTISQAALEANPNKVYTVDLSKRELVLLCSFRQFPKLRSINLSYNKLRYIPEREGIEMLRDLRELEFACNSIESLDSVKNSCLERLVASYNRICNILPILRLKVYFIQNLQVLRLDGNFIKSIKGLDALFKLRILSLNGNQIEKIEGITHMIEVANM